MMRVWVIAIATWLALMPAGALACPTALEPRRICAPNGDCIGPVYVQFMRDRAAREAVEYARDMAQAVDARRNAAGLDRGFDLTRLLLPNLVQPIISVGDCSDFVDDGDNGDRADDNIGAVSLHNFVSELARSNGLSYPRSLPESTRRRIVQLRTECNNEARLALSAYITATLPAGHIEEVWSFLVPRAGYVPQNEPLRPNSPLRPLGSPRLTKLTGGALPLVYNRFPRFEQHIDNRRERAWQYLQNHRNGRAVMSAVSQFIQSRLADGRGEAAICPVAHAETVRLIGELAQP